MLRLYRFPYSTNVERVALALAFKGIEVESVVIDPGDRSPVRAVSGHDLVPVLVDRDEVVTDSVRILRHLEARHPDAPLFPAAPAARAEVELFLCAPGSGGSPRAQLPRNRSLSRIRSADGGAVGG